MERTRRTTIRYSESFKLQIVKEVESGSLVESVRSKYGINGSETVQKWLRKYGRDHLLNKIIRIEMPNEIDRIKELEKELSKTKEALADSYMIQRLLENVISNANKEYDTDLKKSFGQEAFRKKE
jgi:transposase